MKNTRLRFYALLVALQFIAFIANSQFVSIPDSNFGKWLNTNGFTQCLQGNSIIGWQLDTTCPAVVNTVTLNCNSNNSLIDLTGVQYFDNLKRLNCRGDNSLAALPPLPPLLTYLDCGFNQEIDSIPLLPSGLDSLDCDHMSAIQYFALFPDSLKYFRWTNNLQHLTLPPLPQGLKTFVCSNLALHFLPTLPDSLAYLDCSATTVGAQYGTLPLLPEALRYLACNSCELDSLPDLPNKLAYLYCNANHIRSLPTLPDSLYRFRCSANHLITSLPSLPPLLVELDCANNQLVSLPMLPSGLWTLICDNNPLVSLPPLPPDLISLYCRHNLLTSLPDLPDHMSHLDCSYNYDLKCFPFLKAMTNLKFDSTGITCIPNQANIYISHPNLSSLPLCNIFNANGCPFYWNINGNAYVDVNGNCQKDTGESPAKNLKVKLQSGSTQIAEVITQDDGTYSFVESTPGTYTIRVDTTGVPLGVTCPVGGLQTATITLTDALEYDKNFGLQCKPGYLDLAAHCIVSDRFRPARENLLNIGAGDLSSFYNWQCAAGIGGSVQLTITGPAHYVAAATGAMAPLVAGNILTWNIADFGTVNFFDDFNVIVKTDTGAIPGSHVCFILAVTPITGDVQPDNNILEHCFTVVSSYDPNSKEVSPEGELNDTTGWLTYTIHFQNTGTDTALHIYITDTLAANLDISTFQLLGYSVHPLVQITENRIKFNFPNINLPDSNVNEPASHGYVQYKVKLRDSLPIGTEIRNTASIYFDFNAPVQTNTATSFVQCAPDFIHISAQICNGETYSFRNLLLDTSGVYIDSLFDMAGCDSVVELTLLVRQHSSAAISYNLCEHDTLNFNGTPLTQSGIYYDTLNNMYGCDSIIQLTLNILQISETTIADTICANGTYNFHGIILNQAGVYHDTLNNVLGCDSIVQLTLTVIPVSATTISQSICANSTYNFNGAILHQPGIYYDTLSKANGCDSVIALTLQVLSLSSTNIAATSCPNDTFNFNGQLINQAGQYYDTLTNVNGCDSIVRLTLTMLSVPVTNITQSICYGEYYNFNGSFLNQNGVFYDTLTAINGCDSMLQLTLTILPVAATSIAATICDNQTYAFHGTLLNQAGVYYDTLQTTLGCDSIVTLSLSILASSVNNIQAHICTGDTFHFRQHALTGSGIYSDTLTNVDGCDSVVVLYLDATNFNYTISYQGTDTLIYSGNGSVQWLECDANTLWGDTTFVFSPGIEGRFAAIVTQNNCTDTSQCYSVGFTGVRALNSFSVQIYPNPAGTILNIKVDNFAPKTMTIMDVNGRKITEQAFSPRLWVNTLNAGIYFIQLRDDQFEVRKKFVKL
jgi:uncharacterized repeat protein (TIGR01451 family)